MDLCVLKIALWGSTTYQVGGDPITADSDPSPVVIAVCSTFVKNYQVWQENHPLLQCNPECTPTSAYLQSVKYEKGDAIATVVAGRGTPSVKTKFSTDVFIAGTKTFSTTIECAISEILKSLLAMKKVIEEARRAFDRKKWTKDADVQKCD